MEVHWFLRLFTRMNWMKHRSLSSFYTVMYRIHTCAYLHCITIKVHVQNIHLYSCLRVCHINCQCIYKKYSVSTKSAFKSPLYFLLRYPQQIHACNFTVGRLLISIRHTFKDIDVWRSTGFLDY